MDKSEQSIDEEGEHEKEQNGPGSRGVEAPPRTAHQQHAVDATGPADQRQQCADGQTFISECGFHSGLPERGSGPFFGRYEFIYKRASGTNLRRRLDDTQDLVGRYVVEALSHTVGPADLDIGSRRGV